MKKTNNRKNWQYIGIFFLLLGIFAAGNIKTWAQQGSVCDPTRYQTVTRVSTQYYDAQTGADIGDSNYDIWRNGETDHYIHLFVQVPATTIFKAYFNGVEIATLNKVGSGANEYWSWEGYGSPHPIGRVGDVMSITKNGQPYLTGTYTREQFTYEAADGFIEHGNPQPCSIFRGLVYLPGSTTPRTLRSALVSVFANNAITKVTLNEPGQQPGELGNEIIQYTLAFNGPSQGMFRAAATQTNTVLTEAQFMMLRQNLLSVTIHTASGFSQLSIITQGINSASDFEGDGIADLGVFRPSEQKWYLQYSSNNQIQTEIFGLPTDKIVVGDYDSDNRTDIATFQTENQNAPGQGLWQILRSSDNSVQTYLWGKSGDIPVSLNSDTNNTRDLGVFRPLSGTWYIKRMGDIIKPLAAEFGGQIELTIQWGMNGDKPLVGDFNNDNVDELINFRPSEGNWYIYNYVSGNYQIIRWGLSNDIPIAKDFDGDGKVDITVYRPSEGNWYIRSSLDGALIVRRFGLSEDIPVPADFDKDSVADIAIFRPSDGTWYVLRSSNNSYFAAKFGINGDIPVGAQK